jgi:hypothetical protein
MGRFLDNITAAADEAERLAKALQSAPSPGSGSFDAGGGGGGGDMTFITNILPDPPATGRPTSGAPPRPTVTTSTIVNDPGTEIRGEIPDAFRGWMRTRYGIFHPERLPPQELQAYRNLFDRKQASGAIGRTITTSDSAVSPGTQIRGETPDDFAGFLRTKYGIFDQSKLTNAMLIALRGEFQRMMAKIGLGFSLRASGGG